jgi:ABC-type polysaccharide/polyol phosphate export permease
MRVFKDLFQYRELLKSNIKKEIRGKYKGSFLGVLWSFLNPLLQVVIYAVIFPYIMRMQMDSYLIYLITGIIPWTFFTSSINSGMVSVLTNANLIKKVYFPRIILPISAVTSALVNFAISCLIVLAFVAISGIGFSFNLLYLPLIMVIQYIFLLGIVFVLSAVDLYFRDIENIIQFFVNMLFYATPILYLPSIFPANIKWVISLNPMAYIIEAYRDVFYYKVTPDLFNLGIISIISISSIVLGYLIFDKLQRGFAEEV